MTTGVRITGTKELSRRLDAIADTKRLLRQMQLDVRREADYRTRPFRKTGNLGRNIRIGRLSPREAFVVAHANYSLYVEKGTGIYGPRHRPIVPVNKPFLAWRNPSRTTLGGRLRAKYAKAKSGNWIYAKSVRGRPATPFLEPGAKAAAAKNGMKDLVIQLWNGAA